MFLFGCVFSFEVWFLKVCLELPFSLSVVFLCFLFTFGSFWSLKCFFWDVMAFALLMLGGGRFLIGLGTALCLLQRVTWWVWWMQLLL